MTPDPPHTQPEMKQTPAIDRVRLADGVWHYPNPAEAEFVISTGLMCGIDVAEIDGLLSDDQQPLWQYVDSGGQHVGQQNRQILLSMRREAMEAWNRGATDHGLVLVERLHFRMTELALRWQVIQLAATVSRTSRGHGHNRGKTKPAIALFRALKQKHPKCGPKALARLISCSIGCQAAADVEINACFSNAGSGLIRENSTDRRLTLQQLECSIREAIKPRRTAHKVRQSH